MALGGNSHKHNLHRNVYLSPLTGEKTSDSTVWLGEDIYCNIKRISYASQAILRQIPTYFL